MNRCIEGWKRWLDLKREHLPDRRIVRFMKTRKSEWFLSQLNIWIFLRQFQTAIHQIKKRTVILKYLLNSGRTYAKVETPRAKEDDEPLEL